MPAADRELLITDMAAAPPTAKDGFDQAFGLLSPEMPRRRGGRGGQTGLDVLLLRAVLPAQRGRGGAGRPVRVVAADPGAAGDGLARRAQRRSSTADRDERRSRGALR